MTTDQQLSFEVVPQIIHTARGSEPAEVLGSEMTVKGELRLPGDLQHGDELIITVTGPDGEVLSRQHAEVAAPPAFKPLMEKENLLGYIRSHKVQIVGPVL